MKNVVKSLIQPLRSRKVRVALATVLAAYAAQAKLGLDEELIVTILSVGVALILGIAHEDAGKAPAKKTVHEAHAPGTQA